MGALLRWSVFGIVVVAALTYTYNASKRLSASRAAQNPPPVSAESDEDTDGEGEADSAEPAERDEPESAAEPALPAICAEEQRVAERALKMRRDGDTLEHLLRIDTIVFQSEELRRHRLEAVATRWFEREGRDPDASALRAEVSRDCRKALLASPAP
ncbi:MAG TPA: hypothetical protein VM146_04110 [Steroidobacteraceae bacterium]|nr:hypothetical protein [Steroidobacteraceae bacterium]